jgi:hypothetical protein
VRSITLNLDEKTFDRIKAGLLSMRHSREIDIPAILSDASRAVTLELDDETMETIEWYQREHRLDTLEAAVIRIVDDALRRGERHTGN